LSDPKKGETIVRNSLRATLGGAAALLSLALVAPSAANAALITVTSTSPSWAFTGGTNTNTQTSGSGNNTVTQVFWGTSTGSGQSGLGFNPAQPPSFTATTGVLFDLGTLFHYNNPINGSTPTSLTLSLSTNVSGATPAAQGFAFGFTVDETPNVGPVGACPYPSTVPCSDKITFTNIDTTNSFSLGGNPYTMILVGFSTDGGVTVTNSFISNENATNSAHLYAEFVAPFVVPEPATLLVLGAGLLGLGVVKRARNS
jgi:PEP-CTERM motif